MPFSISIGGKVTRYWGDFAIRSEYVDTVAGHHYIKEDVITENYKGGSIELLIGYRERIYLRTEIIELRLFDRRGTSTNFGQNLDTDFFFAQPIGPKISPYIAAGIGIEKFEGARDVIDPRFVEGARYEIRGGIGINYKLRSHIILFVESQWYENIKIIRTGKDAILVESYNSEAIDLVRLNGGVRIR